VSSADVPDAALLKRLANGGDEAAFEALLCRHGPMVLGVCRRVLQDTSDVEDAFQAAFLVFLRKASSLRRPERLAAWLHGVAYRTALKARALRARRRDLPRELRMPANDVVDEVTRQSSGIPSGACQVTCLAR
jgi:RNA polymerase sigma factor (sigma-70 family)